MTGPAPAPAPTAPASAAPLHPGPVLPDDLLADAFEALAVLGPDDAVDPVAPETGEAVVAMVAELLVDARHHRLPPMACRATAPLVLERVVRCYGVAGRAAPVVSALAALAAVPHEDEHLARALEARPDPALPTEVAVAETLADPARRPELLDVLATEAVHVPVLDARVDGATMALRLVPMLLRDGPVACAFTSRSRWDDVVAASGVPGPTTLELTGAELVELWPAGHGLVLNPGSVLGAVLTEREVQTLPVRLRSRAG